MHGSGEPSDWVRRWAHLIRPQGTVLDVACGGGRHVRWLAAQGFVLTGVDRDGTALATLGAVAETVAADIEHAAWPLKERRFDAVVVTNYLWRELLPTIVQSLNPGGVLIFETFADGQQSVGRPSRPDFLLRQGELLRATETLRLVAFEEGFIEAPARYVQRVVAVAEAAGTVLARYTLATCTAGMGA